jgi:hypothetical protein
MKRLTSIVINFDFEGVHCFPDAEGKHAYLQHFHRHLFKVSFETPVSHNNREIEFLFLKDQLREFVWSWGYGLESRSCEDMGHEILDFFQQHYPERPAKVSVFEDGENGAVVTMD